MLIQTFYLEDTLERKREAARFLQQPRDVGITFPFELRASQSVNTLKNTLYKHFKKSQLRHKTFTPFLDNLFSDRMI